MTEPELVYVTGEKPKQNGDNPEPMRLTSKEKHLINCLRMNVNKLVLVKISQIGQPEIALAIDATSNVL